MGEPIAEPDYLRAENLIDHGKWGRQTLTIKAAHKPNTFKTAAGNTIEKVVLEFAETPLRMIVGKLNERLIRYAVGETKWPDIVGKQITLYAASGNWFGQQNVAALRVLIPDGQYRPFCTPVNIGRDITGEKFFQAENKPSPQELINRCETAEELGKLLAQWRQGRPVATHADSWREISGYANAKCMAANWPGETTGDLIDLLTGIGEELEQEKTP